MPIASPRLAAFAEGLLLTMALVLFACVERATAGGLETGDGRMTSLLAQVEGAGGDAPAPAGVPEAAGQAGEAETTTDSAPGPEASTAVDAMHRRACAAGAGVPSPVAAIRGIPWSRGPPQPAA